VWFVYILECKNKSLYTGMTSNLEKRFNAHVHGQGGRFTRSFGVTKLLYQENCATRSDALKREIQIKQWPRQKKLTLIRNHKKVKPS
jgi:putative endonuclease